MNRKLMECLTLTLINGAQGCCQESRNYLAMCMSWLWVIASYFILLTIFALYSISHWSSSILNSVLSCLVLHSIFGIYILYCKYCIIYPVSCILMVMSILLATCCSLIWISCYQLIVQSCRCSILPSSNFTNCYYRYLPS